MNSYSSVVHENWKGHGGNTIYRYIALTVLEMLISWQNRPVSQYSEFFIIFLSLVMYYFILDAVSTSALRLYDLKYILELYMSQ
jgi:hypothetical protein